ncbi:hypothetical protein CUN37_07320 [Enterococcus faecium]|nr:hypothetical protein [Enterococcus faecium]PQC23518.1 hypothetical protein CUN37_07320 [Enterococcus faecium]
MKIIKILAFNLSFLATTILCCGLVFSQLSIYPRYQRLFVHFLNIQHASMPLEVIKKLLIKPIFMASLVLLTGLVTWILGKKE